MSRTLLVTGGSGYLGSTLCAHARQLGWNVVATSLRRAGLRVDVADPEAVEAVVAEVAPQLVIHTAYVAGGARLWAVDVEGSRNVAAAADRVGAHLVHVSTDVVFDGRLGLPYRESDPTCALTDYGRAKAAAEAVVHEQCPRALVARTSLIYGGPGGEPGAQERMAADPEVAFYSDELRNPVQIDDLASALLELAGLEVSGFVHVGGADPVSRSEFAAMLARREVRNRPAPPGRPLDCRLDSSYAGTLLATRLRGVREVLEVDRSG